LLLAKEQQEKRFIGKISWSLPNYTPIEYMILRDYRGTQYRAWATSSAKRDVVRVLLDGDFPYILRKALGGRYIYVGA
jgi:hypothetical protein